MSRFVQKDNINFMLIIILLVVLFIILTIFGLNFFINQLKIGQHSVYL